MTIAEIYDLVQDLRSHITFIQNQIENESLVVKEGTIDAYLWDAQQALSSIIKGSAYPFCKTLRSVDTLRHRLRTLIFVLLNII